MAGLGVLLWQPTVEEALQPHLIQHSQGHSYVIPLAGVAPRAYRVMGDSQDNPVRSDLVLFRDRALIGKPHSIHAEIANAGRGAYSHWHDVLYFSTPTNSDPRYDGYRYAFRASATLGSPVREVLIVALVLIGLNALVILRHVPLFSKFVQPSSVLVGATSQFVPTFGRSHRRILASLIICAVAATCDYGELARILRRAGLAHLPA